MEVKAYAIQSGDIFALNFNTYIENDFLKSKTTILSKEKIRLFYTVIIPVIKKKIKIPQLKKTVIVHLMWN